ncbi:hypothetical protein AVEN_263749-1 [Araneus ventricosus]|uniref:Uncharacterized protein n=1 Tax=Araneus ventricosus TaxID=182803 RepID=A0A4Y2AUS4_ARAVE|nr:hypothetical protein AVEN_263749-1 [Araneus ventricosus]
MKCNLRDVYAFQAERVKEKLNEQKTSSQQQKAIRRQQDQLLKQQEQARQQQKLQEQQAREFNSRLNGDYGGASGKGLPGTPRGLMFLPVFEGGLPQVSTPLTTTSGILPPHFPNHLNSSTSPSRQLSPVTSISQSNNASATALTEVPPEQRAAFRSFIKGLICAGKLDLVQSKQRGLLLSASAGNVHSNAFISLGQR